MKNLFTYLLITVFGLSSAIAQNNSMKISGDNYSLEDRLENLGFISSQNDNDRSVNSFQAKQLEGMLSAYGGYGEGGNTLDIPFTLSLTNEDFEYADSISITFPAGFTINSVSNDDVFGPSGDDPDGPDGDPEPYNGISGQTVSWGDNDDSWGGITPGLIYNFTVNVTVDGAVSGDQTVDYHVSGDGFGDNPGGIDETITLSEGQTVYGIVVNSPDHTTLEVAINAAGLNAAVASLDPLTLFAPTDAAFQELEDNNPGIIDALLGDPAALGNILLYHAANVEAFAADLSDGQEVETLLDQNSNTVTITIDVDDNVFVNGNQVGPADLDASNGVVHVIDGILLPTPPVSFPIDFEAGADAYSIEGFGGAENTGVIPNPDPSGVNTSDNVWQQTQDPGSTALFAGAVIDLDEPADLENNSTIQMDVWTPLADTEVTLRFEVAGNAPPEDGMEATVTTTTTNAWETLTFDFSDNPNVGNEFVRVVVFFNLTFPNTDNTFYADNIEFLPTIFDIVANSDVHETLESVLTASGLEALTADPTADLTLFAPTDAAFEAVDEDVLNALLDDPEGALVNVLLHHAVAGTNLSTDLMDGMEITTAQGETVSVTITGDDVFINSGAVTAQVTVADLLASNGVVHVIDAVLVPEFCTVVNAIYGDFLNDDGAGAPAAVDGVCPINYSPFDAWASEAYAVDNFVTGTTYTFGLAGADVTIWDPSFLVQNATTGEIIATQDEGFSITFEVPEDGTYLLYIHEQGLCGTQSDNLETDNGVPYLTCESTQTVVDIIVNSPDHTTLEDAVILAELDGVLSGEGPFTVFAPTDDAFSNVDPAVLQSILDDPSGLLTEVLQHHVVGALAYSNDLSDGQMVPTLNGENVTIGVGDEITVTSALGAEATVTVADIIASNGVVHVIDVVLAPSILSVDELSSVTEFRMFPNPANNEVAVELQMSESDDLTIDIINVLGQNVKSFDFGTRSSGFNREVLNVNNLPEGMYILNISVGNDQATTKLQINR